MDKMIGFYKETSAFTYLGKYRDEAIDLWENKCQKSLKKLGLYIMNVVLHRAVIQEALYGEDMSTYGDFEYVDYTTPMSEDDLFLTASSMFSEIFRRDAKGFYVGRPAEKRLNLTCRYVSVLITAILKCNDVPCRSRAGWARYFKPGKVLDHWVNEYWDEKQSRWLMFDLDDYYDSEYMQSEIYKSTQMSTSYLDMGQDQFYTAAYSWLNYRKDKKFIKNFEYGSVRASGRDVLKYLFLDFMSIMNYEVNYLFVPMAYDKKIEALSEEELNEVDHLATLMLDIDKNFDKIKCLYDTNPKFRMLVSPLVGKGAFKLLINKKYR